MLEKEIKLIEAKIAELTQILCDMRTLQTKVAGIINEERVAPVQQAETLNAEPISQDTKKCIICGKEFISSRGQKTCSKECSHKAMWISRKANAPKKEEKPKTVKKKPAPENVVTEREARSMGTYEKCQKCGKEFFIPPAANGEWAFRNKDGKKICSWSCLRR